MTHNQEEIWDEAKFNDRIGNNRPVAEHLLGIFLRETPELIEKIDEGIQTSDFSLVFLSAHKLKGMSANLGAPFLREASLQLETAGRNEKSEDLSVLADKLKEELSVFMNVVKDSYPNLF